MEISNEHFTIAVDSKAFVARPEAKATLQGAMAVLLFAAATGEHHRLNVTLSHMLRMLLDEYDEKQDKGGWWKKGWQ